MRSSKKKHREGKLKKNGPKFTCISATPLHVVLSFRLPIFFALGQPEHLDILQLDHVLMRLQRQNATFFFPLVTKRPLWSNFGVGKSTKKKMEFKHIPITKQPGVAINFGEGSYRYLWSSPASCRFPRLVL